MKSATKQQVYDDDDDDMQVDKEHLLTEKDVEQEKATDKETIKRMSETT